MIRGANTLLAVIKVPIVTHVAAVPRSVEGVRQPSFLVAGWIMAQYEPDLSYLVVLLLSMPSYY